MLDDPYWTMLDAQLGKCTSAPPTSHHHSPQGGMSGDVSHSPQYPQTHHETHHDHHPETYADHERLQHIADCPSWSSSFNSHSLHHSQLSYLLYDFAPSTAAQDPRPPSCSPPVQLPLQMQPDRPRKRPRSDRGVWDGVLAVNPKLRSVHSDGKAVLWFLVLQLLVDERMKDVVVWTGKRREFKIIDVEAFRNLWAEYNGRSSVKWDSIARIFRGLFDTVLRAVPNIANNSHNVLGLYQFITEPSYHLGWSVSDLDSYIQMHAQPWHASPTTPDENVWPKRRRVCIRKAAASHASEASPPSFLQWCSLPSPPSSSPSPSLNDSVHVPSPSESSQSL